MCAGTVSIDSSSGRRKLDVDLNSRLLRLSDLGVRAAGRTSEPKSPLLLSNAMLNPTALRSRDALLKFHAAEVDVGRLPLQSVSATASVDQGVVTIAPLSAGVLGGHLNARLRLDAGKTVPAAHVDLRITDLQLGQIPHKGARPASHGGSDADAGP
ncbi:MAG: AsmA family protein [Steroidobacteraceae bacterium]